MSDYSGTDRAVVFVTDLGFLVPTLVAACQISAQSDVKSIADIFIFLVDVEKELHSSLRASFCEYGIIFVELDSKSFLPKKGTYFNNTHITQTTLGRFALHNALPSKYRNIVYIDGDVQLLGDIVQLVNHDVKPGHIAAVTEFLWLCEGDSGKFWPKHSGYLKSLGIQNPRDYFNAGILAFRRDTWSEMAPVALDYFKAFPERCIYHDQSALNAVFAGRREVLSPAYNFNSFYADLGVNDLVRPRIAHFTGGNKPWSFPGPPWNGQFIDQYADFLAAHPELAPYFRQPSAEAVAASLVVSRKSRLRSRLVAPWRQGRRRKAFTAYFNDTDFAF